MLCGCLGIFGGDIAVRIVSRPSRAEQQLEEDQVLYVPQQHYIAATLQRQCSNSAAEEQ